MPKSSDVQITQLDIKESELYNPHTVQKVYHFQTRPQTTGRFSCGRNLLFVGIKTLKAFFCNNGEFELCNNHILF